MSPLAGQEVEQLVTFPIEQSIANLPDLKKPEVFQGLGFRLLRLFLMMWIYFARQLVNEKLKETEEKYPKGIGTPELAPVSTGLGRSVPIYPSQKGSEHKYNAKDLRTMQDWIVARQLNGTKASQK